MYCYDLFLHVSRLNSKKTIFDIMGVVYEYNGLKKQKESCTILKINPNGFI
jgi:hypothetical protein